MSFLMILSLVTGCQKAEISNDQIKIASSIGPVTDFIQQVGGDLVTVTTIIPPGASEANYQPTPKDMSEFSESSIYFSIGIGTEATNIIPNMSQLNKDMKIVPLADIVDAVYPPRFFEELDHEEEAGSDHDHEGRDPHIWMSPKRVMVIIQTIADNLMELDPENAEIYQANADSYLSELKALDLEIAQIVNNKSQKKFIIMHPSLGYFADDYGLEMIAIEEDGKATTAKRLGDIITQAQENDIKVVLYQKEFDSNQAETIAAEIGGQTLVFEPLSETYLASIKELIQVFEKALK